MDTDFSEVRKRGHGCDQTIRRFIHFYRRLYVVGRDGAVDGIVGPGFQPLSVQMKRSRGQVLQIRPNRPM